MSAWIHFTDDVENFFDGLEQHDDDAENSFAEEGLFVYKHHKDFPEEQRSIDWGGRIGIIIYCDEAHVELVQTDPIGDDPDNDEYMIPVEAFPHCTIK